MTRFFFGRERNANRTKGVKEKPKRAALACYGDVLASAKTNRQEKPAPVLPREFQTPVQTSSPEKQENQAAHLHRAKLAKKLVALPR